PRRRPEPVCSRAISAGIDTGSARAEADGEGAAGSAASWLPVAERTEAGTGPASPPPPVQPAVRASSAPATARTVPFGRMGTIMSRTARPVQGGPTAGGRALRGCGGGPGQETRWPRHESRTGSGFAVGHERHLVLGDLRGQGGELLRRRGRCAPAGFGVDPVVEPEAFVSAGRDEDEQPAGQVADVGEAVPVAAGNEEEVAGAGLDGLVAVDETEVTGQDVESLLLAAVGVGRCSAAAGHRCLQHTQGAAGLPRAELDGGGVAVQPLGGAFVAAGEEAVAARPAGVVLVGDGRGPEGHGGLPSLRSRRAGQAEARRRARVATAASRSVAGGRTRGSRTRRWETTAPMK